ncbi:MULTISPECIES: SseB family protein [Acinetobacter]|jgi:hypothetical protein|uniref:Enhanced serine sensitivity protein SseB n=1 Tax=Acinetobacter chengduensis TaxID=2420890 RepID=A0ABX9TTK0_9GAMM|nr:MULTISPECIES: SseB family protein [Acinetobacter]MBI1453081.1 SseB family protein [Acinetobacter sp. FL51]RKG39599.1 enhanced serine sensitivity protein SseB [Acinetobacter sp. WCHAc060007]RLL19159.1 enhanced serine sensitivity protein SseB [Acinetobacter chengduensis]
MTTANLANLFLQASENPELTPVFLQQLLNVEIYALGSEQVNGRYQFRMLQTEQGEQAIPFFLSKEMIYADLGDEPFVHLPARKLFEITQGAILVLNPTSDVSKEFSPLEIDFLLQTMPHVC